MAKTNISWCDMVWNFITGCSKIGAGCKNCYAETMSVRLKSMGHKAYTHGVTDEKGKWLNTVVFQEKRLNIPSTFKKPQVIFVNSMSDIFHEHVGLDHLNKAFHVMQEVPRHTYLLLTKRYQLAVEYLHDYVYASEEVPNHIWIGFSVCNKADAINAYHCLKYISDLGWNTFVSYEPALEEIDWSDWGFINWLIVGGESGINHRPMKWEWLIEVHKFCRTKQIPLFVKQDSGRYSGRQGRIPDWLWAIKEFPWS